MLPLICTPSRWRSTPLRACQPHVADAKNGSAGTVKAAAQLVHAVATTHVLATQPRVHANIHGSWQLTRLTGPVSAVPHTLHVQLLLTLATVTTTGTAATSRRVPAPGSSLSSSSGSPSPPSPYSTSTAGSFVSASAAFGAWTTSCRPHCVPASRSYAIGCCAGGPQLEAPKSCFATRRANKQASCFTMCSHHGSRR